MKKVLSLTLMALIFCSCRCSSSCFKICPSSSTKERTTSKNARLGKMVKDSSSRC